MIDKCPECGGEIQATTSRWLSGVRLNPETGTWDYDEAEDADTDSFYCPNDHDLTAWFLEQQREAFKRKAQA